MKLLPQSLIFITNQIVYKNLLPFIAYRQLNVNLSYISTALQIVLLDQIPDVHMYVHLPEFLDGLFTILGDNNKEIRKM